VACVGERRGAQRILVGESEGKNHLKDLEVDRMVILKWISEKWDGMVWTGLMWFWIWTRDGLL
jgi:hypothetical protein